MTGVQTCALPISTLHCFPVTILGAMRQEILKSEWQSEFVVNNVSEPLIGLTPYRYALHVVDLAGADYATMQSSQEGLGIKTYQSDLFNNWLSTEWIDGVGGINEITRVDTTDGYFTIDAVQLAKKVYDMLNRIAVSGGSYDDWLNAVYDHESYRKNRNTNLLWRKFCGDCIPRSSKHSRKRRRTIRNISR